MTKKLTLAASMMMLVALSGQAFAESAAPKARQQTQMTELPSAYGAFDQVTAQPAGGYDNHRYTGGPKYND